MLPLLSLKLRTVKVIINAALPPEASSDHILKWFTDRQTVTIPVLTESNAKFRQRNEAKH